jgi:hypothetical protein
LICEFDKCFGFVLRCKIISFDALPTAGTISINPNKQNSLLWSLGNKFTNRNLEVALPATIYFETPPNESTSQPLEDPFCIGQNAYISVQILNLKIVNEKRKKKRL